MIVNIEYIRPNITIEIERIDSREFFIYNDRGISYKVFRCAEDIQKFLEKGNTKCLFECDTEEKLGYYFKNKTGS